MASLVHTSHIVITREKRKDATEALNTYLKLCPGAQSVIGCIDISHELIMEDL